MNSIFENRKTRIENQRKTGIWDPETSAKNAVQEFHLWPFKIHTKKSAKQEDYSWIMQHFVEQKKESETQKPTFRNSISAYGTACIRV
jgi:hypothetical protein